VLVVDAATGSSEETVDTISPGRYKLEAINLLPTQSYTLQWSLHTTPIDPIPDTNKGLVATRVEICKPLAEAVRTVDAVTEEREVPGPLARLRALTGGASQEVQDGCKELLSVAEERLAHSYIEDSVEFEVKGGQFLRVRLRRAQAVGPAKEFKWRLVAPRKGAWITSFGVAAIFLPTGSDERPHFAKGDSSNFVLTPKARGTDLTGAPFVLYSWLPKPTGISPLFSGGLGLDKTATPAVFLGGGVAVNSNLLVSVGGSLSQVLALSGKYKSGEVVTTNLDDDQVNERIWRVRPFVGVSWRFATNPFKSGEAEIKAARQPADSTQP
jgi:hypothetical protein